MREEDYLVSFDLEEAASEQVKKLTKELMQVVAKKIYEITFEVADDYINNYLENDAITNLRDGIRQEVLQMAHYWSRDPNSFYGKCVRDAIWKEHREEILPIIQNEAIELLTKELEDAKRMLEVERELRREYY